MVAMLDTVVMDRGKMVEKKLMIFTKQAAPLYIFAILGVAQRQFPAWPDISSQAVTCSVLVYS